MPTVGYKLFAGCKACSLCVWPESAAGSAINAAVALENQLLSMFGPLLSLATIIRFDPYYPNVNASFDTIAQQLLDQVRAAYY
jgi:hypothetical protein